MKKVSLGAGQARDTAYDWLRLIATLFVVIGHSSYLSIHSHLGGVDYILPEDIHPVYYSLLFRIIRKIVGFVSSFHMPLFFMLSGAVLALKDYRTFDTFAEAKFKRLIIPYFLYGLGFMLPVKCLGNFYNADNFAEIIKSFLKVEGGESGHLWFLPALFWCMMVFEVMRGIFLRLNIQSVYLLILGGGGGGISYLCKYMTTDIFGLKTQDMNLITGLLIIFAMSRRKKCCK